MLGLLRRQDPDVIPGLEALIREFPLQHGFIRSMILYAEIGRDRRKLRMDYVQRTREQCLEFRRLFGEAL